MDYDKEPPKRSSYVSVNSLIQPKKKSPVLGTDEQSVKEQERKSSPQEIAEHQTISSVQNKDQREDPNKHYLRNYYQDKFRFLIEFIPKEQYDALLNSIGVTPEVTKPAAVI